MVLISHIIIALVSLALAATAIARPSMNIVKVTAGTIAATLASGTVLIFQGASMLHLCVSGLLFTSLTVSALVISVRRIKIVQNAAQTIS